MFRKKVCCIGDHTYRGRSAPYWSNMCWSHYSVGFFPPVHPDSLKRLGEMPGPFDPPTSGTSGRTQEGEQ